VCDGLQVTHAELISGPLRMELGAWQWVWGRHCRTNLVDDPSWATSSGFRLVGTRDASPAAVAQCTLAGAADQIVDAAQKIK
jgi:hypothetical protein